MSDRFLALSERRGRRLGDFAPEVKPLYCQLMPDHIHRTVN